MNIKRHIPNLFTLGNLFCGTLAIVFAVQGDFILTAILVLTGIFFDFFDGFFARILGVSGELGKQLDSLADMVTSGVVPGLVMFGILNKSGVTFTLKETDIMIWSSGKIMTIQLLGLILTLSAAYRLAIFNIDTRQSESFIGLPTPAMSLFVVSLPVIQMNTDIEFVKTMLSNNYVLIGITLLLSYLMNANLPLFSLKFKNFGWQGNGMKYVLIIASIVLLITLQYLAVPIIIILYVVLSMIENLLVKKA